MANSVGSIEVTVTANTGKLKAHLVEDGKIAGEAAAAEIEKALKGLEASLAAIDGKKEAKFLRKEIEAQLRGIPASIELDLAKSRAGLKKFEEEVESMRLVLDPTVELSEEDLAEIEADWTRTKEIVERNKIQAQIKVDWQEFNREVDREFEEEQARLKAKDLEFHAELVLALEDAQFEAAVEKERAAQEAEAIRIQILADWDDALAESARVRAELEAEEFEFQAALKLALEDAILEAEQFRLQQERDKVELQAELEIQWAEAQLEFERMRAELEAEKIRAEVELQDALADAQYDALVARWESEDAAIELDLESAQAQVELDRWLLKNEGADVSVAIDLGIEQAKAAFEAWLARQEQRGIDVSVDPDTLRGTLAFKQWVAAMEAEEIDVKVKADTSSMDLLSSRLAKISAAVLALGENAAVALQGAAASATSVLSSAIQGLGAAAGAAVPLVVALGGAFTAAIVGTQGFGDALSLVNEEFALAAAQGRPMNMVLLEGSDAFLNLAPAAREAAVAFAAVRDEMSNMRRLVQQELFSGMASEIEALASKTLPELSDGLRISAQSVNEFGKQLSAVAQKHDFRELIEGFDPVLDDAFDAGTAFADMFLTFVRTATPAAERLAEMIERGAESLREWTEANPTEIREFLDDGLTSLRLWGNLLASTGDLLGTIFDAGAKSGDGFVVSLNNIIERWDSFLESAAGQEGLGDFFDSGRAAIKAFEPVLEALAEGFKTLVDDDGISQFEKLGEAAAKVVEVLIQVMEVLSDMQITSAVALLAEGLGYVVEAINAIVPDGLLELVGVMIVAGKTAQILVWPILAVQAAMAGLGPAAAAGVTGVAGLSAALKALVVTNAPLLAMTAVVTGLFLAFKVFGHGTDEAAERAETFNKALMNTLDTMIATDEASQSTSIGIDSLNAAMFEGSDGAEKIEESFIRANNAAGKTILTMEDTVAVLSSVRDGGDDSAAALAGLAEDMGLPTEAAKELADIVNSTDDNMAAAAATGTDLGRSMTDLAEKTGIPRESLVEMFGILEEIQDQGENMDLSRITDEFDRIKVGNDEAAIAALAMAENQAAAAGVADDAVEVYKLYAAALFDAKNATDEDTDAILHNASAQQLIEASIEDQLKAFKAKEAGMKAAQEGAFDAWKEEERLAREARNAAVQIFESSLASEEAGENYGDSAEALIEFGDAMGTSAEAADALDSALDKLLNPFLGVQEAAAAVAEGQDELAVALAGGEEAMKLREDAAAALMEGDQEAADQANFFASVLEEQNKTLDLNTEAGRTNAEAIRDQISAIADQANALITSNASMEEVTATANAGRDALIELASGFFVASEEAGTAQEQAEAYINSLGLTPELVNTVFSQPGLVDALLNVDDLSVLYNDAGEPVITEFEAAGIDPAMASVTGFRDLVVGMDQVTGQPTIYAPTIPETSEQAEGLKEDLDVVGDTSAVPTVEMPSFDDVDGQILGLMGGLEALGDTSAVPVVEMPSFDDVDGQIKDLTDGLDDVNNIVATPTVEMPSFDDVDGDILNLKGGLEELGDTSAIPVVEMPSADGVENDIDDITRKMNSLDGKTVTTYVRQRTLTASMTGRLVTGPMTTNVGEHGYAEAIIPLQLPINRIDPSVRGMAELLRGGGGGTPVAVPGGEAVHNHTWNITEAGDARTTAHKVINRMVALV